MTDGPTEHPEDAPEGVYNGSQSPLEGASGQEGPHPGAQGTASGLEGRRTVTIGEAAAMTGLSLKAVKRRVERGTLRSVRRDGRRRVLMADLVAAGLLRPDGAPRTDPERASMPTGRVPAGEALIRELFEKIESHALELGRLRALTEAAEVREGQERERAERLEAELLEARARVAELEAQTRRRWPWRR